MSNTPSTAVPAQKTHIAFFTRDTDKGPKVELFKVMSTKERAPVYSGKVGDQQVSLFLRKAATGQFLSVVGEGNVTLGTANIRTRAAGSPVLVISLHGDGGQKTSVFASVSKMLDNDTLVSLGLNLAKQAEKIAAAKAAKASLAEQGAKELAEA